MELKGRRNRDRRRMLALAAASLLASPVIVGLLRAYPQADAHPAFAAASIRPASPSLGREGGNRSRIEHTPTSLTMSNISVGECVQWAYGVAPFQVSASRAGNERYDIRAKTDSAAPLSQLRIMLRELLTSRFKLELRREIKMLPVYELVVARGGPRLPEVKAASGPSVHAAESIPRIQGDSFLFADVSMGEFAAMLAQLRGIELPVVDRTGISGTYDIELKSAPAAVREADTAGLFALLQQQLGLRLVSGKAPFEMFTIERAERPSAN